MKKILSTLIVFIAFQSYSQSLLKLGFKWKKPDAFVEIPEQFKNEEAVAVYQEYTISNMYDFSNKIPFFSFASIRQRIRIQSKEALDDIATFSIWKFPNTTPVTIDARTIKKSGETIESNRESIKELKTYDNVRRQYRSQYRVTIPGVEVGDDVEIIYSVRKDYLTYSEDIFLAGDYPILKSKFTLNTQLGIITDVYNHNGMPEMRNNNTPEKTIMVWEMSNLLPLKHQHYCITDNELPFIRMHIKEISLPSMSYPYPVGMQSWNEMYDWVTSDVYNRNAKDRGMQKYIASLKPELDKLGTVDKVAYFVNRINKDFDIVRELDEKDRNLSFMEQFEIKKTDNSNLVLFYKYLFHYLNIPASMVLGKSKYRGSLQPGEITSTQITDVLFMFKNEKGSSVYICPSDADTRYNIDEIPYQLENTRVVLLDSKSPDEGNKAVVSYASIGRIPDTQNQRSINCHYTIGKDGNAMVETKASYTGMPSTYLRKGWSEAIKSYDTKEIMNWLEETDSIAFKLDTLIQEESSTTFPFNFNYMLKNKIIDAVSEAGDGVSSAKVKVTPSHFLFSYSDKKRTTKAFYPFAYTDNISVFIEFPQPSTILNENDFKKNKSNELGIYEQKLERVSPTVYKLTSTYKCTNPVMSADKFNQFAELNDFVKQNDELNILYKAN